LDAFYEQEETALIQLSDKVGAVTGKEVEQHTFRQEVRNEELGCALGVQLRRFHLRDRPPEDNERGKCYLDSAIHIVIG
jgi:hypothetical protein